MTAVLPKNSVDALGALIEHFHEVIDQLQGPEFTSHQFILFLARNYQRPYVQAPHYYRENGTPFQTLHGQLSAGLHKFRDRLVRLGDVESVNNFSQQVKCTAWRKRY